MRRCGGLPAALFLLLLLSGCALSSMRFEDSGMIAEGRMESILHVVEERDSGTVEALFAESALEEAGDLTEELEELYALFPEGAEVSWENNSGTASKSANYGVIVRDSRYWFNVTVGENAYWIAITERLKDTEYPENEGIWSIYLYNVETEELDFSEPGVYVVLGDGGDG